MNIKLSDPNTAQIFTNLFRYLQSISDNITIELSPEQLFIQGIDQSHACLFEIVIKNSWFDIYNVSSNHTISLSSSFIFRVLNTREETQIIDITYHANSDILSLSLISDNSNVINKHF
jgi:hypothetical protein